MSAVLAPVRRVLGRWFHPAPDSLAAHSIRMGKSPWVDAVHLLWTAWIFVTPIFDNDGWNARWLILTAVSYPVFLAMYAKCGVAPRRLARFWGGAMIAMSLALLPWYPGGLTYFVFGCVMLRVCAMPPRGYLLTIAALDVALILEMRQLGYPWQTVVSIPLTTFIIGIVISAERMKDEFTAKLRLSHDEVRRLAANAERERIGRDLHDLLGHTLSLITLKLELSRKLFDHDTEAARREVQEAERVARHALAEVRAAVTGIRATDLAAELASARLLLGSSGVHLDYGQPPTDMPAEVERSLALVLREAVTNIARHAGATRAQVEWTHADGVLDLCVADDGRGGIAAEGNGLSGMRERVRSLGGTLEIDSPRGHGTRLRVLVPCAPKRAEVPGGLARLDDATPVPAAPAQEQTA